MPRSRNSDASSGRVLSNSYIEKYSNKKDLIRRLRNVVEALKDQDVEPNSPDYPGLGGLSAVLVQEEYLEHRDKEVRLHTVLACMQLLEVYAPEAPYDNEEVLNIFAQLIRQLANLSHCTSPSQANYQHYHSLLELLSDVKIGIILVELTKTLDEDSSPPRQEALEMLADLLKTILTCVNMDHPPDVSDHAVIAVSACLDEFEGVLPIPVMDELLLSIAAGPAIMVTNPAAVQAAAARAKKKKKKEKTEKMPPMQIQQTNQSYMVAAAIIRRSVDRISTPIANFLNNVLNGDTATLEQTNISSEEVTEGHFSEKQTTANVWTIIYELHKIAPQILTTVIGTVTCSLKSPNLERRLRVTKLLARLFYAPTSNIGVQFSPCFREWTKRAGDAESKVRLSMVKYLVMILQNKGKEAVLAKEASQELIKLVEGDPSLEVRLAAIHQVCDLAYREGEKPNAMVSARLLQAVGNRIGSKNKTERRDALTGLAQIYYKYYMMEKLKQVERGGDDCDVEVIIETLRGVHDASPTASAKKRRYAGESFDLDEKYKWIPRRVFESACVTDSADPELRNRLIQVVDDVLLGSKKDSLTPTSRAVGLAIIFASLRDDDEVTSNAHKWMCSLFAQRSSLQAAVGAYLDARSKSKSIEQGTEEALAAEAQALEQLRIVASCSAPQSGSSPADIMPVLEKLHAARDKHIFRILATIASPDHSASARIRAFDELPKRTKSLGDSTAAWVKTLARRCAMGLFVNAEVVQHCIILAQDCFGQGEIAESAEFLACVKTVVDVYPSLGAGKESFESLQEMFSECRSTSGKAKQVIEEYNMVTTLSAILAKVAPVAATMAGSKGKKGTPAGEIDSDLQANLLNLCTRDGTPGQARSAVFTMAALMDPSKVQVASSSSNHKRRESLTQEKQQEAFGSVLKSLTLPSRLTLTSGSGKIVSILSALAALAESAPDLFSNDGSGVGKSGEKAIKFALETCLLGRGSSVEESDASEDEDDNDMSEDEVAKETPKRRRSRKSGSFSKNMTPDGVVNAVEDETLSLTCRRLCAAIELVVSYIRYCGNAKVGSTAQKERVEQAFSILCQIIEDGGLPPATRDRRECKSRQDRAALRKCAATNLLRLCDARLKLEADFLSTERWHTLASSLLDEERSVRDGVMEELSFMLSGQESFGQDSSFGTAMSPNLRFVAMVTLCIDADHGAGHSGANANAANVGKRSTAVKTAAANSISKLRVTADATLAQCRRLGAAAEDRFEQHFKMMLMPEYAVPHALHLLSFRRETPSAGGTSGSGLTQTQPTSTHEIEEEAFMSVDEENQHKVLRKRLKWLFEPLVHTLGDGADNISFLLRMVDLLGNNYQPIGFGAGNMVASSPMSPNSLLSEESAVKSPAPALRTAALGAAKLKTVSVAAREVLLSFVKKDVNLTTYPGAIQLPKNLFRHSKISASERVSLSQQSGDSARASLDSSVSQTRGSGRKRSSLPESILTSGRKKSRTSHLSPASSASFNRDSLDSNASVGTTKSRRGKSATQETADSPKRHSRVHFSPELVVQRRSERLSQASPAASEEEDDDDEGGFAEGMSPIAKEQSPSPPPSNVDHRSVTSEEKTVGTTPPSTLRTAPHDEDESDDGDLRLSMESEKSESTSGSRRSTRSSTRRKAAEESEPTEAIESEETMTTSETPLSVDPEEYEESHSPGEKRKPKRAASTRGKKKSKKEASPPATKIQLNRGDASGGKKKSARGGRRTKVARKTNDEFDFPDDDDGDDKSKENSTNAKGRSRKKQRSAPAKKRKPPQKTKISMGTSKAKRRARRT